MDERSASTDTARNIELRAWWMRFAYPPYAPGAVAVATGLMIFSILVVAGAVATGTAPPAEPAAVGAYLRELAHVEGATAPVSMEPLLADAEAVQTEVMAIDHEQAWIERLTEPEFADLQARLRGLVLSRGLDVYAQPDPGFMLQLAQAHGREADADFFRVYRQHWGKDLVPVFLDLEGRATPCVRFGDGVIPEIYEAWRGFVARRPGAYIGFSVQAINDLEEAVALGTCACGDQDSVLAEERGFLKRFPDTRVAAQIQARILQIQKDPDARPVHCR